LGDAKIQNILYQANRKSHFLGDEVRKKQEAIGSSSVTDGFL
jgi:hypothetical protein